MTSRTRVNVSHLCKMARRKSVRRSEESGPQSPMDERDLPHDQATNEDIVAVADSSCHLKYLATLRMGPPATPNGFSSYQLGKRRHRPLRGLEYDPVLTNEVERLA